METAYQTLGRSYVLFTFWFSLTKFHMFRIIGTHEKDSCKSRKLKNYI